VCQQLTPDVSRIAVSSAALLNVNHFLGSFAEALIIKPARRSYRTGMRVYFLSDESSLACVILSCCVYILMIVAEERLFDGPAI